MRSLALRFSLLFALVAILVGTPPLLAETGTSPFPSLDLPDPDPTETPPRPPIVDKVLKVDPGDHTGPIRAMAASADGSFLATSSLDETIRVWDTRALERVNTWRRGRAALDLLVSGDGRRVAAASKDGGVFDMLLSATGSEALPQKLAQNRLLWLTQDGRDALAGDNLCRLRRLSLDGEQDELLGDRSDRRRYALLSAAAVYGSSTFALACMTQPPDRHYDVWVTDPRQGWISTPAPPTAVSALAFSPDGEHLAVSTMGSGTAVIYDLGRLRRGEDATVPARRFDDQLSGTGHIASLGWSKDGVALRGLVIPDDDSFGGRLIEVGPDDDRDTLADNVTAVAWLPEDQIAVGHADGRLEVLNVQDAGNPTPVAERPPPALPAKGALRVSEDGLRVLVSFPGGRGPDGALPSGEREFDLRNPGLHAPEKAWPAAPPASSCAGRVCAVGPDGAVYEIAGTILRKVGAWTARDALDVPANSLVVSPDGTVLVARHDDGTLRWYDTRDGKPIASLFLSIDADRWVLWTPAGYYVASVGGDALAGWEVNRGEETARDFYSFQQLSPELYRPDVIRETVASRDPEATLRAMKLDPDPFPDAAPPVLTARVPSAAPSGDAGKVTLEVEVEVRSDHPVSDYRLFVDGRRVPPEEAVVERVAERTDADGTLNRTLRVTIPAGFEKLDLFALAEEVASAPATIHARDLIRERVLEAPAPSVPAPRTLWMLGVGIDDYQDPDVRDLQFAEKDVRDMEGIWRGQIYQGLYTNLKVDHALGREATRERIDAGLAWVIENAQEDDLVLLFLSGHGDVAENGDYYFASYEVDPERLAATGYPGQRLIEAIGGIRGQVILMLDTCHSGGVTELTEWSNRIARPKHGAALISSSLTWELSQEHESWGNGAFTSALRQGFSGEADQDDDGIVSIFELEHYVPARVGELTSSTQSPAASTLGLMQDIPLARVPGGRRRACDAGQDGQPRLRRLEDFQCSLYPIRERWPGFTADLSFTSGSEAERRWCEQVSGLGCSARTEASTPWRDGERTRVMNGEIQTRVPLDWEDVLTPDPDTVLALADQLRATPTMSAVIEVSAPYSDLAAGRARALWEAMIRAGLHPRRLSMRTRVGDEQVTLRTLPRGDESTLQRRVPLPWDGSPGPSDQPPSGDRRACDGYAIPTSNAELLHDLACATNSLGAAGVEAQLRAPDHVTAIATWCADQPFCQVKSRSETEHIKFTGASIVIKDVIAFETNQAELLDTAVPILRDVAAVLAARPEIAQLVVEGHADNAGSYLYNYDLSVRRASAVVDWLVASGVPRERLSYRGLGKVLPVGGKAGGSANPRDRRVEFHVLEEGR